MKKQTNTTDLRKDWKNEAEDEIILLQDDIDTLDIPEDVKSEIDKYITRFKDRLNDAINLFEVTAKIALQTDDILDDILFEATIGNYNPTYSETERMVDIMNDKGVFIPIDSLAERIRVENFVAELTENPYQLKLIAC